MANLNFQQPLLQFSVSHDLSEIILPVSPVSFDQKTHQFLLTSDLLNNTVQKSSECLLIRPTFVLVCCLTLLDPSVTIFVHSASFVVSEPSCHWYEYWQHAKYAMDILGCFHIWFDCLVRTRVRLLSLPPLDCVHIILFGTEPWFVCVIKPATVYPVA